MRIKKRNGHFVAYDPRKVRGALLAMFSEVDPGNVPNVVPLVDAVGRRVCDDMDVEAISLIIEDVLMDAGFHEEARRFISYRLQRDSARMVRLKADNNALTQYIEKAKYCRHVSGRRETWTEAVGRVRDMHIRRFPDFEDEITSAFKYVEDKKVVCSMRSLQFGGPAIERDHARMYNCSFTHCDRVRVFAETMYLLLCGCGVGYSVQFHHVERLPPIVRMGSVVLHHTVGDTIEGWAEAVNTLMEQAFWGGQHVEFDYSKIRDEGVPLITSGGKAPGHLGLKKMLESLRSVLIGASGRSLRPIEVHDMMCYIAEAVLSGGIRRSSLISLFSLGDSEMMYCKSPGCFSFNGLNNQRQMANNSAVCLRSAIEKSDFERLMRISVEGFGEPGFYFTDCLEWGCNPCGEIGMFPRIGDLSGFSFCNLTEVNCFGCNNIMEFLDRVGIAAFIGTLQATYTDFNYLSDSSRLICERDALLGVSLTGMMDNPRCFEWLIQGRGRVRSANNLWADRLGVNRAARMCTIKPSGTASLALGCVSSGIHPQHSRRHFRRVTANPNEPVAKYFKERNPHMVEVKPNGDWCLVFPVECGDDSITVKDMLGMDFLEKVLFAYDNWVDHPPGLTHNVSSTVTIRDGELESLIEKIWERRDSVAAMSFAPLMLDENVPFIPRESVGPSNEGRWNDLLKNYRRVEWDNYREESEFFDPGSACEGPSCEVN